MSDLDHLDYTQGMTDQQRALFQREFSSGKKDTTTGVLLTLFLGGLGAHHFYMGKNGLGVVYILFCWTFIPALIALVECFLMPGRVRKHNQELASDIAVRVKAL